MATDNVPIQGIEFTVVGDAADAEKALAKLAGTLATLKGNAANVALGNVATQLKQLGDAIKQIGDISNITKLGNAIRAFNNIGKAGSAASTVSAITDIAVAVNKIPQDVVARIEQLGKGIRGLSSGKQMDPTIAPNLLQIAQAANSITDSAVLKIERLGAAVRSLANGKQMDPAVANNIVLIAMALSGITDAGIAKLERFGLAIRKFISDKKMDPSLVNGITQLAAAVAKIPDDAVAKIEKLAAIGKIANGKAIDSGLADGIKRIANATRRISNHTAERMVKLGKAISGLANGKKLDPDLATNLINVVNAINQISDESIAKVERLGNAMANLKSGKIKLPTVDTGKVSSGTSALMGSLSSIKSVVNGVISIFKKLWSIVKKVYSKLKEKVKVAIDHSPIVRIIKALKTLWSSIARIAFYRAIRSAIKAVTTAFSEGLEYAYRYAQTVGDQLANTMDKLSSARFKMSNQMGAALGTLLQAIEPILLRIINLVTRAAEALTKFFALLGGRSTYIKAIDYTKQWKDETAAGAKAAEEWKNVLLGFDEINRLDDQSNNGGGGGSALTDYENMFETVNLEENNFFAQLKAAFEAGEWDELGKLLGNKLNEIVDGIKWDEIGKKVGKALAGAISMAYNFLSTFDFLEFGRKIAEFLNNAMDQINWAELGQTIAKKITAKLDLAWGFATTFDWKNFAINISSTITNFLNELTSWLNGKDPTELSKAFADFFQNIDYDGIKKAVGELWSTVKLKISEFLDDPNTQETIKMIANFDLSLGDVNADASFVKLKDKVSRKLSQWTGIAFTAIGAKIGYTVGGPVGALVGASVGAILSFIFICEGPDYETAGIDTSNWKPVGPAGAAQNKNIYDKTLKDWLDEKIKEWFPKAHCLTTEDGYEIKVPAKIGLNMSTDSDVGDVGGGRDESGKGWFQRLIEKLFPKAYALTYEEAGISVDVPVSASFSVTGSKDGGTFTDNTGWTKTSWLTALVDCLSPGLAAALTVVGESLSFDADVGLVGKLKEIAIEGLISLTPAGWLYKLIKAITPQGDSLLRIEEDGLSVEPKVGLLGKIGSILFNREEHMTFGEWLRKIVSGIFGGDNEAVSINGDGMETTAGLDFLPNVNAVNVTSSKILTLPAWLQTIIEKVFPNISGVTVTESGELTTESSMRFVSDVVRADVTSSTAVTQNGWLAKIISKLFHSIPIVKLAEDGGLITTPLMSFVPGISLIDFTSSASTSQETLLGKIISKIPAAASLLKVISGKDVEATADMKFIGDLQSVEFNDKNHMSASDWLLAFVEKCSPLAGFVLRLADNGDTTGLSGETSLDLIAGFKDARVDDKSNMDKKSWLRKIIDCISPALGFALDIMDSGDGLKVDIPFKLNLDVDTVGVGNNVGDSWMPPNGTADPFREQAYVPSGGNPITGLLHSTVEGATVDLNLGSSDNEFRKLGKRVRDEVVTGIESGSGADLTSGLAERGAQQRSRGNSGEKISLPIDIDTSETEKKITEALAEIKAKSDTGIKDVTTAFVNGQLEIEKTVNELKDAVNRTWDEIQQVTRTKTNDVQMVVTDNFQKMKTNLSKNTADIKNAVVRDFTDIANQIRNKSNEGLNNARTVFDSMVRVANDSARSIERAFASIRITIPAPKLPHITYDWIPTNGEMSKYLSGYPDFRINWYARGGIFNRASIIGVGENGKEAVVPLERNMEWVGAVADQLYARMLGTDMGGDEDDMYDAIYRGMVAAMATTDGRAVHETALYVNGREFARAIYNDQQAVAKEHGISLIRS